jgi:hypothetical protein
MSVEVKIKKARYKIFSGRLTQSDSNRIRP